MLETMFILSLTICFFCIINSRCDQYNDIHLFNTLVINLDRHQNKYQYILKQLNLLNISFERISAVDGKLIQSIVLNGNERSYQSFGLDSRSKIDITTIEVPFHVMNPDGTIYSKGSHYGVIGCMQSHIKAYYHMLDKYHSSSSSSSSYEDIPMLILEDDVLLEKEFHRYIQEALQIIPIDWDILAIGHIAGTCIDEALIISNILCKSHHFYATHAYLVRNTSVAQKLLEYSNTPGASQVADHYWHPHFSNGDLHAYILYPHTIADQNQQLFRSELRGFQQQVPELYDPVISIQDNTFISTTTSHTNEIVTSSTLLSTVDGYTGKDRGIKMKVDNNVNDDFTEQMLQEIETNEHFVDQIIEKYYQYPTNVYLNNLMGVMYYKNQQYNEAVEYFKRTCILDGFTNIGYLNNLVNIGYHQQIDIKGVKDVLYYAVFELYGKYVDYLSNHKDVYDYEEKLLQDGKKQPDEFIYTTLIDIYQKENKDEYKDLAYKVSIQAVLQYPQRYDLWNIFIERHISTVLSSIETTIDSNNNTSSSSLEQKKVQWLIYKGLRLFPRCPGLNYLQGIYSSYSHTLFGMDDLRCTYHFFTLSKQYIHFATTTTYKEKLDDRYKKLADKLLEMNLVYDSHHWISYCPSILPFYKDDLSFLSNHVYYHNDQLNKQKESDSRIATTPILPEISSSLQEVELEEMSSNIYLQIGCSEWQSCVKSGWYIADAMETISTHIVTNATNLSMIASSSIKTIYSSHTLEHLSHVEEVEEALHEWNRILIPHIGTLLVAVPDFEILAKAFNDPRTTYSEKKILMFMVYGGERNQFDYHKSGFYEEYLRNVLQSTGFCNIIRVDDFNLFHDASRIIYAGYNISLNIKANKC